MNAVASDVCPDAYSQAKEKHMDKTLTQRRALIVHINGMERVTPLAGGYLKAYAMTDPELERTWDISLYSTFVDGTDASKILRDVRDFEPDLVGFSVYVWNAGLVRRMLPVLRGLLPRATFIMGGVEVMNAAAQFIHPSWENVIVCNGEGERTFRDLLRVLNEEHPNLENVNGISFFRDGAVKTTDAQARIKNLDEIPSPYLLGYFDRRDYSVALLETNRGCPYKCEYCYWGGAVGQKVHRLSSPRLCAEIEHLGKNRARAIYLCDANFGMFPQDIELAKLFVETKDKMGYPRAVRYSSAKNNPDRALEVARVLAEGKILSVQPISLQSMSDTALVMAGRETIRHENYFKLQHRTNELGIASFIELIWPLPGETLASFKKGLQDLCIMSAQAFSVYPLLWLNNVGYNGKEPELGVVTFGCGDSNSSAKTVIQTKEVTFADWVEGLMYTNAVQLLYGCRAMYNTCNVVAALGITTHQEIFERFQAWMDAGSSGPELTRLWRMGRQKVDEIYSTLSWPGHLIDAALHTYRNEFNVNLRNFVKAHPDIFGGPHAELVSAALDLDILARPYVYANTLFTVDPHLEVLKIVEEKKRGWVLDSPFDLRRVTSKSDAVALRTRSRTSITVDHNRGQVYRMPGRTQKEYWDECRMYAIEMGNHYPTWKVPSAVSDVVIPTVVPTTLSSNPIKVSLPVVAAP